MNFYTFTINLTLIYFHIQAKLDKSNASEFHYMLIASFHKEL